MTYHTWFRVVFLIFLLKRRGFCGGGGKYFSPVFGIFWLFSHKIHGFWKVYGVFLKLALISHLFLLKICGARSGGRFFTPFCGGFAYFRYLMWHRNERLKISGFLVGLVRFTQKWHKLPIIACSGDFARILFKFLGIFEYRIRKKRAKSARMG